MIILGVALIAIVAGFFVGRARRNVVRPDVAELARVAAEAEQLRADTSVIHDQQIRIAELELERDLFFELVPYAPDRQVRYDRSPIPILEEPA